MLRRAFDDLNRLHGSLCRTHHRQYGAQLQMLHQLLKERPVFRSMIEHLAAEEPDLDPDKWITDHVVAARNGLHTWPSEQVSKMKVLYRAVQRMTDEKDDPISWGQKLTMNGNFDEGTDRVTEEIVTPLIEYLVSRLGTESQMLHLLGRFKRQVEWFEQRELFEGYTSNTQQGEDVYDRRLRRFLFGEGIEYPFSKPRSASGEADIIADIDADDPLVCEIKLFDGDRYGAAYIGKGLRQAVRYAHDYVKAVGHLVVVNLSDKRLSLPSDGDSDQHPPRIVTEGVTVFMVVVQGKPRPTASKEGKVETVVVPREQLVVSVEVEELG